MVFESLVVDILNKFLGDYVENLDRSQLKIGIWGGDVSLKNLSLKPSALDELNLPVKTVYGHLGKLTLKIPWKNIYTAPVEVSVENLFLLVNPIQDVVYNSAKEEKLKQEIKQSLINKVEVAKKTEKEKDSAKVDDTFVEKLAAQIIKNVQVFIENIHIRYEDRITKPEHPFSIGMTLHTLTLHTTNESCDRYILPPETSPIFYKKMNLEGLSVYWNTNSKLFTSYEINEDNIIKDFLRGITCKGQSVADYSSILGPINSEAKMQINSKPEMMNFITPKMFLSLVLDQLFIHLSRSQYQDLISLVETFDRMAKGTLYRKYRPNLKEYKGHYKEWWKFAITSIIEEDVKRKFKNWDWTVIRAHGKLCRAYQQAYRAKLTQKPTDQITKELNRLELELDAFNIILLRQKVENEVEREGSLLVQQKSSKKGWFGGWFSSSKAEEADLKEGGKAAIAKKFETVMTDDEKKRLYKAIDYHEVASPMMYPTTFVAIRMEYVLRLLRIDIEDDYSVQTENKSFVPSVLRIEFTNALVNIQQRPAAQSLSLSITMQSFQTLGLPQNEIVPQLIKSKLSSDGDNTASFLSIFFETNPEDENYDQRLHVTLKPLKVVYDAQTVIRILEFFTPEKDISTVKDQLQIAANTKLEEMKEKSAMRLQYAIEKSIRLDLKIDLMAPYLIIPFGGFYTKNEASLVINLGRITVESKSKGTLQNVKKLFADGRSKDDILNQMMSQCYDRFHLSLGDVQMLTLNAGESWKPLSTAANNLIRSYILHPTSISIDIFKCLLDDDPRLPKIKIDGSLPDVTIQITEKKLLEVVALVLSVPLPQKTTSVDKQIEFDVKDDSSIYDSSASLRQKLESFNKMQFPKLRKSSRIGDQPTEDQLDSDDESISMMDLINVEVNFHWKALTVYVQTENVDSPLIEASVSGLELKFVQRSYSLEMTTKLKNISLTQNYDNSIVPAVTTPVEQDTTEHYLFACKLLMAEKNSPIFEKMYNNTGILVEIDFAKLYIVAHQEAILSTLQWVNNVQAHITRIIESYQKDQPQQAVKPIHVTKRRKSSVSSNVSASDTRRKKLPKPKSALGVILEDQLSDISSGKFKESRKVESETTELKLTVRLNVIQMCLQTALRPLATMDIDGFNASVLIKKSSTSIDAILQSVSVGDLNSQTIYNKVAYITEGKDALKLQILMYNNEKPRGSDFDVLVKLQMNCLQCVFINEFMMDILDFMNNFQASKQMIMDASAAAVASAKQNVQEVYQSSTTVSLDIFADAPIIIVPQNNQSDEIFVIDFGNLSVKNVLKKIRPEESNREVVTDEIFTNLENMKIVRTNYQRTATEHVLLKPVNYTLVIKRNLSASWFSGIPTFDIDGSFCPIHIMIRDRDYEFLMNTLSENIGSKSAHKSTRSITPSTESASKSVPDSELRRKGDEIESEVVIECTDMSTSEITTMMRFTMAVESVTIELFSRSVDQPLLPLDDGLAKFTLSFLCVKGNLLTNADLSVHAFLSDCCVDDTRACKAMNKVKRYMQRKTVQEEISTSNLSGQWSSSFIAHNESAVSVASTSHEHEDSTRSMIDVTFEQKSSQMHVNARVFSFIMILNVDHIMKIQEFFTPKSEVKSSASSTSTSVAKKSASSIRAGNSDIDFAESTPSVISCSVTIEKPDIILVENLDDINTNAMILNNEAKLFIQMSNDNRMGINGVLKNLQLYSCCYNPAKRSQTTALILHPVTVDLMGSTSDSMGLHLDMKVSEIKISITAGTIGLLAKISSTLTPNVESSTEQNELHLNDYSNIWQQKAVGEDYWFLKSVEEGLDIAAISPNELVVESIEGSRRSDVVIITAPRIEIMLEAGIGKKTIPLLALQSSFQGTVNRSQYSLLLDSYVSLEVGYYNSRLALWEPIIEPFLRPSINPFSTPRYEPWQMQLTVQLINQTHDNSDSVADNSFVNESSASNTERRASALESLRRQPAMSIFVKSEERMELTFTKTCMDVVNTLTQSFNQAVNLKSSSNLSMLRDAGFSSYTLINDFGVDVILSLKTDQAFKVLRGDYNESVYEDSCENLTLKLGETINLLMKKPDSENERITSSNNKCLLEKFNNITDQNIHFINLIIPEKNKEVLLPVSKSDKRYFSLRTQDGNRSSEGVSENWGLISEVDIVDGSVVTTLRSVVRVFNHFSVELSVFYLKPGKNKNELIEAGKVGPSQHLNLPVQAVYTTLGQLYFAPTRYSVCNEPFVWKNLQNNVSLSKEVHCISKNAENEDPFFIRILGEMEQVYYENTMSYTISSSTYNIHLRPTLIFKNFIPVDIVCCLQGVSTEHVLKPGQRLNICTAEPDKSTITIRLDNYMEKIWTCRKIIKSDAPVFSVWAFTSNDNDKPMTLNLGVWYCNHEDSMIFALYCPFWMVNKTGFDLSYKGVDDDGMILQHPKHLDKPVLFSFKEKLFFSKKKSCVRINDGEWSDKLSIDAAGSSGSVSCSYNNQVYQLGIYIKLTYNSLTKQVIFSPFFTIFNNCPFDIEFREDKAKNATWITIPADACNPFWPVVQEDKDKSLELRISGTNEITPSFSYVNIKIYPLILLNKYGGLIAEVQVTEGGIYIEISQFHPKFAPALIINDTESLVEFSEVDLHIKSLDNTRENENAAARCLQNQNLRFWQLQANKEVLFTWSCIKADKPVLLIDKNTSPIDLRKDGIGEFSKKEDPVKKYWISFLNGMQRVLLLTTNQYILKEIEAVGDFDNIKQEIVISLEGIGFSLVNNFTRNELLYLSMSSSGVIWEMQRKTGKRFKAVSDTFNEKLEKAYAKYSKVVKTSDDEIFANTEIDMGKQPNIVVNFAMGTILSPMSGNIRRVYNSGLWIEVRSSERYNQIHAKVNRLQVDNQIYDAVFPVILYPIPPPKSIAASSEDAVGGGEKPFAELSIVERINEGALLRQFKYFKVLIQEFHVKVDIGFINGLVKFFEADNINDEEEMNQFQQDERISTHLSCQHIPIVSKQDFFDLLHFSPLKIHISFSLAGENPNDGTPQHGLPVVNFLTQSIGVTLTDVNDVVFRLAYFERKHKFYSQKQILSEVQNHYIGQFVKQLYVLVLGLDVLGNPFGLVTGLKQGVEDFFYEPFQGAIQGPSEFAEGVLLGVRSLFGHTVGGAAGAVGRITGAMGKGIAALTLDEEYQRKRRQRLALHQQSITEGGRGLVMGVVEGVGGVISKPISGAREEGVEGFVKGVGKGVVGLFMRPASGVVDFASGTVDVVRRVATCSEETRRYRLPRIIKENGLVEPFSKRDARGYKYLLDIEKGRFIKTDTYLFYVSMASAPHPEKEVLLITNSRVIYLMKSNDIFTANITIEWQYTWSEIRVDDGVTETEDGICLRTNIGDPSRPSSGGVFSIFKKSNKGKILVIPDIETRRLLLLKMKELVQKAHRRL